MNSLIGFLSELLIFCEKMSEWAICSKKRAICSFTPFWWATWAIHSWSLIFGEQPDRFAQIAHFWWAKWAICSHGSLKKREWANRSFFYVQKRTKRYNFSHIFLSESLIRSFIMSDLIKSLTVTHLSWETWAIRSRLLFWHEQPERFAHSRSFVLSDLSESLTVAHSIWAIWAGLLVHMILLRPPVLLTC